MLNGPNKFKHLFKEMFEGLNFYIGCLMKMLNGENKFKHLFKEMFEGSKFDIGCLLKMVQTSSNICLKKCMVQSFILDFNEDVKWPKQVHTFV